MNILIVTPNFPPDQSGIALQPYWQAKYLGRENLVTVLTLQPRDGGKESGWETGDGFNLRRYPRKIWLLPWFFLSFCRLVRKSEIISLQGNSFLIWLVAVACWLFCRPYVVTLHGSEVWRWPAGRFNLFRFICRRARKIVAVSRVLAAKFEAISKISAEVIYPTLDEKFFNQNFVKSPVKFNFRPLLINVKGIYPVENQSLLLEVLAKLVGDFPQIGLLIIGDGPDRAKLVDQAKVLGLEAYVKFLGWIKNSDLPWYYQQADLTVISSNLESFGITIIESLACGTPVVSTATAGAEELAAKFPEGVSLSPVGNASALAAAIRGAIARLASEKKFDLADFSPNQAGGKYYQLYAKIISQ